MMSNPLTDKMKNASSTENRRILREMLTKYLKRTGLTLLFLIPLGIATYFIRKVASLAFYLFFLPITLVLLGYFIYNIVCILQIAMKLVRYSREEEYIGEYINVEIE